MLNPSTTPSIPLGGSEFGPVLNKIRDTKDLDKDAENNLKEALLAFGKQFQVDAKA